MQECTYTGLKRLFINIASAKSYASPDLNNIIQKRQNIQARTFKALTD
jgi:hypothetical protein